MKIYTGWVLSLENQEFAIIGSMRLRGTTTYILKNTSTGIKSGIDRNALIQGMTDNTIQYVKSIAV